MSDASTHVPPQHHVGNSAMRAADAVLALINSQPRTPSREQIAAAIAGAAGPSKPSELPAEGRTFREAAEWRRALIAASHSRRPVSDRMVGEIMLAHERVGHAARRVWARPASSWGDVAARMLVAAKFQEWPDVDAPVVMLDGEAQEAIDQLIAAVERVTGIRRITKN